MKTTMELPEALLREAKAWAAGRGVPLRQVIVEALAQETPGGEDGFHSQTLAQGIPRSRGG